MGVFVRVFLEFLVTALWLLVIGRVLISWVNPRFEGPVGRFLYQTTEPLLGPMRRLLPQSGMVDWSPLVLMLVLGVVVRLVILC